MFLNHKFDLVNMDDVKTIFDPNRKKKEPQTLDELLRWHKEKKAPEESSEEQDSAQGSSMDNKKEDNDAEAFEDFSDLFTSDEEECKILRQPDCEDIVSDEEW